MSEQLTQATRETKENAKTTAEIDKDVDFLMNKMQSLEAEVNATERYSRSYNARFLGVSEITGEQCAKVVDDILRNKLGQLGKTIEHAHRGILLCGSSPVKYELLCSERRAMVCDRTIFVLSTT